MNQYHERPFNQDLLEPPLYRETRGFEGIPHAFIQVSPDSRHSKVEISSRQSRSLMSIISLGIFPRDSGQSNGKGLYYLTTNTFVNKHWDQFFHDLLFLGALEKSPGSVGDFS